MARARLCPGRRGGPDTYDFSGSRELQPFVPDFAVLIFRATYVVGSPVSFTWHKGGKRKTDERGSAEHLPTGSPLDKRCRVVCGGIPMSCMI